MPFPCAAECSSVATPEFESQNAFVEPVAVVPKRGGDRWCTCDVWTVRFSVSAQFGS